MTGYDLYLIYMRANNKHNIGIDDWDDLSEMDQEIWEDAAKEISQTPSAI